MLRDTDVPTMMMRVEATLDAAERSPNGARGVMRVATEGDRHLNIGKARQLAEIELEFPASSDRAVVGKAVRVLKRGLRRSLRWYVTPMVLQQTRFNHAAVDLFEGLRLSLDRLARRVDALQPGSLAADGGVFRDCRTVAVVGDGPAPAPWSADTDVRPVDDATGGLGALEPASLDAVLAHTADLDAAAVAAVVESAFAALAPGGKLVVLTTDAAPIPAAAVAWAATAAGLVQVRLVPLEPAAIPATQDQPLAEQLDAVARRLSEPRPVAVLGVRPRVRP